jgi:hypothetical protein
LKTYVKIYGPPLAEALNVLQRIAAEMPEVSHYHILSGYLEVPFYPFGPVTDSAGSGYALESSGSVTEKATHPLISKSGHTLGDHDFFFEWREDPTWDQMRDLISKIDKAFASLGCKYTLTTK